MTGARGRASWKVWRECSNKRTPVGRGSRCLGVPMRVDFPPIRRRSLTFGPVGVYSILIDACSIV